MYSAEAPVIDGERQATQLPKPAGFKMLIALPEVDAVTEGGVIRPDALVSQEQTGTVVGFVVAQGPDAYQDPSKFPSGPWCKEGDFVVFRAYTGTRIKLHGQELRLINDDSVEAVVTDPRGISRV
jgi:co-chaperonin GroES (HSP10)